MSRLKKSILLLFCSIFVAYFFVGQGSAVAEDQATWAKVYGDTIDYAYDVSSTLQTTEGGYIVTGYVVNLSTYNYDVLVLKLDAGGNIQWQKAYDINNYDFAYSIQQTIDGGYIVAGYTFSVDGLSDALVLKLDANGNIQWQKTYGGSSGDWVYSIQQTTDGGYIIAGATFSFGSYYADLWILKLDSNGNIQWQKAYNKREMDSAYSIQQTTDGGYIVAGQTRVYNEPDIWVLKLDSNGNIMWDNIYGGNSGASASAIVQTTDGGYVVTGRVKAYGEGMYDAWVLKLDGNGNIQWQKTYGGSNYDSAYSIQQTTDGGYILSGNIDSFFAWALRLDMNGNILWQKAYGENGVISSIRQTTDGGFIMAGRTSSFGNNKVWILKTDDMGNISTCSAMIRESIAIVSDTNASIINLASRVLDTNGFQLETSAVINDTNLNPLNACLTDTTPPFVTISATPNVIWPPNHKLVNVVIDGSAIDNESGIESVVITVTDEYGIYNMTVPGFGSTIQLEAWREGTDKDGRRYTITVIAKDKAGNQSTATTEVIVPHDMGK